MTSAVNGRKAGRLWLRLVLLLCVMNGVAVMHTLGHPHMGMDHGAESRSALHTTVEAAAVPASGAAHAQVRPGLSPLAPTTCPAIVDLLLILAGVAAGAFRRCPGALIRSSQALVHAPRARRPPGPPSLSRLQVLRI